jgi:hypothetical protein
VDGAFERAAHVDGVGAGMNSRQDADKAGDQDTQQMANVFHEPVNPSYNRFYYSSTAGVNWNLRFPADFRRARTKIFQKGAGVLARAAGKFVSIHDNRAKALCALASRRFNPH